MNDDAHAARWRALLASPLHDVFVWGADGSVIDASFAASGLRAVQIFADAALAERARDAALHAPQTLEAQMLHRSLRPRWFSVSMTRVEGTDEVVVTALELVTQDLERRVQERTERLRERTEALSRANAELARTARMRNEFLANMSHDLRTPLNAVLGLSGALLEGVYGPLQPQQSESLRTIESSGRDLLAIINDLLDLARIDADRIHLARDVVDVRLLVDQAVTLAQQAAEAKGLRLSLRQGHGMLAATGDVRRLRQTVAHLLANAILVSPEGGTVDVAIAAAGCRISITVRDSSVGIGSGELFETLQHPVSAKKRHDSGAGLRLSLVQRLAELHGGSLAVEPNAFTLHLPRRVEEAPAERTDRRVLVLSEDDACIAPSLSTLMALGATVSVVRSAVEVVQHLEEWPVDAVVVHVRTADHRTLDSIRAVRALDPARPICVLSALDLEGRAERFRAAGATRYLLKPVEATALAEALGARP